MQLNPLITLIFYGVPFYNNCLNSFNISCLFSSGITISSIFLELAAGKGFGFTILSAILFVSEFDSLVDSADLWTTFLETVLRTYSLVSVALSNNFFPYLLNTFLANDKNQYPLTYFLVLGSIVFCKSHFYLLISNVKLNLSSFSN